MSTFKISREKIKLFKHDNADLLEIGKVGIYQVVVEKGMYKDGDVVIFIPEKSILPPGPLRDEFIKYLAGPNQDRVKSMRFRGQLSCGVIVPPNLLSDIDSEIGVDISGILGITKYIPEIPKELLGEAVPSTIDGYVKHDVEQFLIYADQFVEGERVIMTEKIHGVQTSCVLEGSDLNVMSKGLSDNYMKFLITDENVKENLHLKTVLDMQLHDYMQIHLGTLRQQDPTVMKLQVVGELTPMQKGYNYGGIKRTIKIFDVVVIKEDGPVHLNYDQVPDFYRNNWVPILYDGPYSKEVVLKYHKGKETLSGKSAHIREGGVLKPYVMRRAEDGTRLVVKILNPDYKETGEELS